MDEYQDASAWAVMRTPTVNQEYLPDILKGCFRMTMEYISQA
jgi:hypothetical protein